MLWSKVRFELEEGLQECLDLSLFKDTNKTQVDFF